MRRTGASSRRVVALLGDERGGITTFVVLLVVPLAMMAGLAFDGGRILAARRDVIDTAQQAALAGAQAVDGSSVRRGEVAVDPALVQRAAASHLAAAGHDGAVTVTATEVTVTVSAVVDMRLLSIIGVGSKTVTGSATSRLVRGIHAADP